MAGNGTSEGSGAEVRPGEKHTLELIPWGAVVVLAGLAAIVAVSITAMLHYKNANNAATATVGVTGVIATLVGAYFGIRGSSLAQTNSQDAPKKRD